MSRSRQKCYDQRLLTRPYVRHTAVGIAVGAAVGSVVGKGVGTSVGVGVGANDGSSVVGGRVVGS